ncbi:hypothetical protein JQ581_29895 [Bradyrhizobium liaoningense]|uniref:hypothetical protein n=1 Tax=Bradyrhizobium liaoningense TaxID=43992 RepID=UPI001BA7FF37|nr:hypothetical protein [Bradyrhizobium liaoningense]MBR0741152.1 hypothetical protein [Bradyrhizobium liaoningense]
MSVPFLSVKPRAIRLKVLPQFPARLIGRAGVDVTKEDGDYYLDLDFNDFPVIGAVPAGVTYALIFDPATGQYAQLPITLLGGGGGSIPEPPADALTYGRQNVGGTGSWTRAVAVAGDTMTGDLTISKAAPQIIIDRTTAQSCVFVGKRGGLNRWHMAFGSTGAETGGNAGSDFNIVRYDDAGGSLGAVLTVSRATGLMTLAGDPTAALGAATKAYVDARSRPIITAVLNVYVNAATGSDSNNGLSPGAAFATLQKAMDTVASLDLSIYGAVISVADGTYAPVNLKTCLGGPVTITGNTTTPGNCKIVGSSPIYATSTQVVGTTFNISGFRLETTNVNAQNLTVSAACTVNASSMEYAGTPTSNYHVYCNRGSLFLSGSQKVFSSALGFLACEVYGYLSGNSASYSFGASVTFSTATLVSRNIGYIEVFAATWSLGGFTVTGTRYSATYNAGILVASGNASTIPGTVAGTVSNGGFYVT